MSVSSALAYVDNKVRPLLTRLPASLFTAVYSSTRRWYSVISAQDKRIHAIVVPPELAREVSGLVFRSPLFNAAGMYKYAEGYETSYRLGAGAFLSGTTTYYPRKGNTKNGITHPFAPYPYSHAASNWMGLPNEGHAAIAKKMSAFNRYNGFPIGASIASDPGMNDKDASILLLKGIELFIAAKIDFIEINESCPNTEGHASLSTIMLDNSLIQRLEKISSFIKQKGMSLPIFVKFSNDTELFQIPELIQLLLDLKFAGVNFGNTSTRYEEYRKVIKPKDLHIYDYFTTTFGGGISGNVLRPSSIQLCSAANTYMQTKSYQKDFAIISTGGIETGNDIVEAEHVGASLTQWYTGYYEQYGIHGKNIYKNLYSDIIQTY